MEKRGIGGYTGNKILFFNEMIALITPTGGRPKQIDLCSKWMKYQDYSGEVLWVIVDDCVPVSTDFLDDSFRVNWKIKKVYPKPSWNIGDNTQCRNLLAAIDVVKSYKPINTFIIEDDDYYKPYYLTEMMKRVHGFDVIGERFTIYYNVVSRGWRRNGNRDHASLFQTAVSMYGLEAMRKICEKKAKFIDLYLFRNFVNKYRINMFDGLDLSIGIKGLPGRPGIGIGHKQKFLLNPDPDFMMLKKWIGDDYIYYL